MPLRTFIELNMTMARQMKANITITGIEEVLGEDASNETQSFF